MSSMSSTNPLSSLPVMVGSVQRALCLALGRQSTRPRPYHTFGGHHDRSQRIAACHTQTFHQRPTGTQCRGLLSTQLLLDHNTHVTEGRSIGIRTEPTHLYSIEPTPANLHTLRATKCHVLLVQIQRGLIVHYHMTLSVSIA